ncbi:formate dehydrogenase accessory sulfurtransferase FdhD [Paracoccus sp. MC1862]|nr:formate dehydrogenase accessory sulfurtransferase FdhD [Paracoccus sp. MC1854]MBB1498903.1 formate dehydrogenase accessory sulfurtransferase FdhD [Paracoccus sp. MC1862]QQO46264.1 formate dehydrogenase accessory sulfurtransferase FdhD [Paracoccus sp. MC1862]
MGAGAAEDRTASSPQPTAPAAGKPPRRWSGGWVAADAPAAPEEAAVAIVIDGTSQAVLMATPHDLADFALGFALTEGLIASSADVTDREITQVRPPAQLPGVPAYEARLWLRPGLASGLAERRRSMVGPVGCGLCGVDSIAAALPQVVRVAEDAGLSPQDVGRAMQALSDGQRRWRETPAIHAAGFWSPDTAIVREDVGRHNALDKLAGAMADQGLDAKGGAIVMSSRLSVDLVQKTARIGASVLIGASTPTRLAIAWAEAAGITLIGRARGEAFDLYTHPQRMKG